MTTDIIQPEEKGQVAFIGDSEIPVSMQIIQDLYNEITGKNEELKATYRKKCIISINDLIQLNHKITQMYEQYHIASSNCNVTLYHKDEKSQCNSSFEKFLQYDSSITSPLEAININYNLLIRLPKVKRLQKYKISITILSGLTIMSKIRSDNEEIGAEIFIHPGHTITARIEYVDYTVAKVFSSCIDGWVEVLKEAHGSKTIEYFKKRPLLIPSTLSSIVSLYIIYLIFSVLPHYIKPDQFDLQLFFKFSILSFITLFALYKYSRYLGARAEAYLRTIDTLFYIDINAGDKAQKSQFERNNKKSTVKAMIRIGASLVIGILASVIANILTMSARG